MVRKLRTLICEARQRQRRVVGSVHPSPLSRDEKDRKGAAFGLVHLDRRATMLEPLLKCGDKVGDFSLRLDFGHGKLRWLTRSPCANSQLLVAKLAGWERHLVDEMQEQDAGDQRRDDCHRRCPSREYR